MARKKGGGAFEEGGEVDTPMHTMPTIIALIFSNFTTFQQLEAVATRVADCNKEILRQV